MKITDFNFGDRIKRKGWNHFTELNEDFHYKLDLGMEELLSDDWEKEPKKVKKEGWVNIYHKGQFTGAIAVSSPVYPTIEDLKKYHAFENCPGTLLKIEWEEEE